MSEVTNSTTTLSSPAGQAEGKLKVLPLQHLRGEKKPILLLGERKKAFWTVEMSK